MSRPAIRLNNLGKEYIIGARERGGENFREMLTSSFLAPFRRFSRLSGKAAQDERIWALRNVDLEIEPGEVVGVIGRNGAGKSTLLKILSRITAPTEGRAELVGRCASLLEVGTGFHRELTGRENIYLNGAILGMTRREIDRRFDDIVEFSEVEKFLDTPVKRYSIGMYTRLAFAVAANLDADVLIVDEVLSVGDVAFQKKCIGAMENIAGTGRTVIFVSHNMGAIERLCSRSVFLKEGQIEFVGSSPEAISAYLSSMSSPTEATPMMGSLADVMAIRSLTINGETARRRVRISPSSEIVIELVLTTETLVADAKVVLSVDQDRKKLVTLYDVETPEDLPKGAVTIRAKIPSHFLSPGDYEFGFLCFSATTGDYAVCNGLSPFSILSESDAGYDIQNIGAVHLRGKAERLAI